MQISEVSPSKPSKKRRSEDVLIKNLKNRIKVIRRRKRTFKEQVHLGVYETWQTVLALLYVL
ncbi:hypothetical protein V2W34_17385 [Virgibacillus dokdonensis]|uniref:Transposase n=1 Tax=Virgibacillus dokdonensis TaxID=302167 RepID=A0ABU7VJB9_9BACI